jgi:hypothetical protein
MAGDAFESVAIIYSQPETVVMLATFERYGIPTYAAGFNHARAKWSLLVALGGIAIRVHPAALAKAQILLAEVAERPAAVRPRLQLNQALQILFGVLGMLLAVPPPTRVTSTFFLGAARQRDDQPQG